MSKLKQRTQGDLSINSPLHQAVMADPETNYTAWQYNVANHLKDKTVPEIKKHLQETANPFAVCFEHWTGDFNLATGVRNANGFNAQKVYYVGDKKWDRRGAVGVHNYTDIEWLPTMEDFLKLKEQYVIVGIDNVPGSVAITSHTWKKNTLMVFGEEGTGLTPGMQALCEAIVYIPMFGSVRSFNCGTSSGIAMYDFVSRYK